MLNQNLYEQLGPYGQLAPPKAV